MEPVYTIPYGEFCSPQILVFTQPGMRRFLRSVRTVAGHTDRMFGFGFNTPAEAIQLRGDPGRRFRNFSAHLLTERVRQLRKFLGAR